MKSLRFQDFDAFSSAVRDIDATMMLQRPSRRLWTIHHVYLPDIHVQLGRLGSGNIVEGQSWPHGYLLYLPLTEECAYSANGIVLPRNSFMILEPGCEFCISTKFAHDWCSIFVPTYTLARGGHHEEPSSASPPIKCRVSRTDREYANQFRDTVEQIMVAAADYSQFESSPAAQCAAAKLLQLASVIVGQRPARESHLKGRPRVSRREMIGRSMEMLEGRDGECVCVSDLAHAAGVSERTLRNAFHEYFGVGPVRYLQLRQLHRVRSALRVADPNVTSVTDVLLQCGEMEFSRFAQRYRQQFGELPSETLRATRR